MTTAPKLSFGYWTGVVLFMLAAAPILGSGTTVVGVVSALVAIPVLYMDRPLTFSRAQVFLVACLLGYFFYFMAVGTVRGGFADSFQGMYRNLPILLYVPLVLLLPQKTVGLTYALVGRTASYAVLLATVLSLAEHHVDDCHKVELLAGNALPFATLMAGLTLLCPLGWAEKSTRDRQLSAGAIICGLFVVIFLADSRTASLTTVILVPLVLWLVGKPLRTSLVAGVSLLAIVFALGAINDQVCGGKNHSLDRYVTFTHTVLSLTRTPASATEILAQQPVQPKEPLDESVIHRLILYKAGFKAFLDSPIFGHGPQNRFLAAKPYMGDAQIKYSHLHNTYLTHAVGGGLVGLVFLLGVILSPVLLLRFFANIPRDGIYLSIMFSTLAAMTGLTNLVLNHDLMSSYFAFAPIAVLTLLQGSATARKSAEQAGA